MPITQDRILNLIQAGETFIMMFDTLASSVDQFARQARRGDISWEQAFAELSFHCSTTGSSGARHLISMEHLRYQLTHKKNESEARRMRRRRGEFIADPRAAGPRNLDTGELAWLEEEEAAGRGMQQEEIDRLKQQHYARQAAEAAASQRAAETFSNKPRARSAAEIAAENDAEEELGAALAGDQE